jgi:hypothetical protein
VVHTHNYGVSSYCLVEKIIKRSLKSAQVFCVMACCNYRNCKEERRDIQSWRVDRDSVLDVKEVTEQTAANCTVDWVGKNCNCNDICVVRVGKGQRNELCFKTAYRNCECECVNVTWSGADCVWSCFSVQLKWAYCDCLHIYNRMCDDLQSTVNNKTAIQVFTADWNLNRNDLKWAVLV